MANKIKKACKKKSKFYLQLKHRFDKFIKICSLLQFILNLISRYEELKQLLNYFF